MNYQLSEQEFLSVYNKYKPNFFITFMYKYFTPKGSIGATAIAIWFVIMNIITIVVSETNPKSPSILPLALVANSPLFIWGIPMLIAGIMNTYRHRKIMKELNIKKIDDYDFYVDLYVNKKFK